MTQYDNQPKWRRFPPKIHELDVFSGPFEAFKLDAKDCSVLFASYSAGTNIEPDTHKSDNWGVITHGEMIIDMNGTLCRYGPGDWYHIPPHTPHAAHCDVDTDEIEFWFTTI